MDVEIRGREVDMTNTLRAYIERRLGFALDRFARRIRKVRVKVGDVNSGRGGVDKRCQLIILLAHSSMIAMESRAASVYAGINRLAGKAGSCLARRFKRTQEHNRYRRDAERLVQQPPSLAMPVGQGPGRWTS